jgi:nanoRNase/pAp phosphatase (c-di-AMP/oligoRNAs hydrolase)
MRLITRGDLDGLASSVFITQKEDVSEMLFAHPKDMQDGLVDVQAGDIITNLPYHPSCSLWFDHHESEDEIAQVAQFRGRYGVAPSAARLVYEFYDDRAFDKYGEMLSETDRVDSARLAVDDVLHPAGWVLLSYTLDPRSGLGAFAQYFQETVDAAKHMRIGEILEQPEAARRVERFLSEQERFEEVTRTNSYVDRNVIVTDFRELDTSPVGNRFMVYTIFPQGNVSVRVFWGKGRRNIVVAVAKSIFNRTSKVHIGKLLGEFGGGGLPGAGTAQFSEEVANTGLSEIIKRLQIPE